jgi:exopolysaccharide biosynthesis predicted pyruvyltransferase EpsI
MFPSPAAVNISALLSDLNLKIEQVLLPLLSGVSRVVLLGFPNHKNVGDSAIWCGESAFLKRHQFRIVYTCDYGLPIHDFPQHLLNDKTVILLQGGGDIGDLWTEPQQFREHIMTRYRSHYIIQLPQSIHFSDEGNLNRFADIVRRCERYVLLARDEESLRIAREELGANAMLCPDMAFCLRALPRFAPPVKDIVWLLRRDKESVVNAPVHVLADDWTDDGLWLRYRMLRRILRVLNNYPRRLRYVRLITLRRIYDTIAWGRLLNGCRLLGQGRVVITDRLHGHIISLLMGVPHVILDNSYGKVSRFYQTWTYCSALTRLATTVEEARSRAAELLAAFQERRV